MLTQRPLDRRYPLAYQAAGARVVAGEGALDLRIVQEIDRTASTGLPGPIVIDLTGLTPIDETALAALCDVLRRLGRRGASVAIVDAKPHARDVLDAAALQGAVFTATVHDALRALQPEHS